ncbi:hypothetical protein [Nonomuraea dietziae]|uniref:hypothetical protein n=1 Tax=Nonomuraea dietziae TaxID=65515 RepID=UPI0031D1BE6B
MLMESAVSITVRASSASLAARSSRDRGPEIEIAATTSRGLRSRIGRHATRGRTPAPRPPWRSAAEHRAKLLVEPGVGW